MSAAPQPPMSSGMTPPPRRIDSARHLLQRWHLSDSAALARQPSLRNSMLVGLQAGLTVIIALPLVLLSPWAHLIGFASLGALAALFGRFETSRGRRRIVLLSALCQTMAVLAMSTVAWLGLPGTAELLLLALACGVLFFVTVSDRFGPPGSLIFVFAAGASLSPPDSFANVLERGAATAAVALLAWIICLITEGLRHRPGPERRFPAEPIRPLNHRLVAAARIVLGAAVALFVSRLAGADHPLWAAMGALAVMQGPYLHINLHRALQRMAGTVLGATLAWVILIQDPSVWTVIAALFVLQFVTELVIGSNYALGQIFVTPMALLMTQLAAPQAAGAAMAPERVLDTLLGASVGIVIAVLLSTLDDRHHLATQHAERAAR
ncbi:FUSC family protein [Salipiger sp. P9]|uniref:FUSC family protein n=1 Tax=Salipiger pentaromativorans TaxID=2943193 RepID=UPI0021570145|nr:FUSC family protein [Salipiger pentaromativorans]MCR8547468.1 FUSC family protein [Salipiger pentaromativorans]